MSDNYMLVLDGDSSRRVDLVGQKCGYSIDLASEVIRVWDQENTYLLHQRFLVLLKLENAKMRGCS